MSPSGSIIASSNDANSVWAYEVDWPIVGKLEGPQSGILYGLILVVIIFFMPGGIVYGLRQLRSKFIVFVPRLPAPQDITPFTESPDDATAGVM